jgi:putative transposase
MLGKRIHRVRYSVAGHARYLTFSCFHNLPLFRSEHCCQWFITKLAELHAEGTFELWAWVLMPTHVHLLLMPHDPEMIPKLLFRLKKSTTNHAISWLQTNTPEFLTKLHDHQPNGKDIQRF